MGKIEEEQSLSSSAVASISIPGENVDNNRCENISKFVRFRCVIALLFGAAVFLSAIFWLPPLYRYRNRTDLDPNSLFKGHDVVAMFKLQKPVSLLNANIPQLEHDILDEIGVSNSMVNVLSLEPSAGSNSTNVVFGVDPYSKYTNISSASLSLLRASFVSLVLQQSSLHLTPSLFGDSDSDSFEVLKFHGGITVIPQQSAFLLQKVQILFNFTLNFSIHLIQENFHELKDQLKSGLHLNSYENLYVSLTNLHGSTVAPPTTIQASVLLTVGNLPPPLPRLKQLAQTITGSPARNLGLNNTVFGKVKSVSLSTFLQHSLDSGGSSGTSGSPSPSPAPLPHPSARQHHHHHHHHHHHSHPPEQHHHHEFSMAPAPAPEQSYPAEPPSGCPIGHIGKNKQVHIPPTVSPVVSPRYHAASPSPRVHPPAPASHSPPASSPLPAVVLAPVRPPSEDNKPDVEPPDVTPSVSPSPSPLSAGFLPSVRWSFALLLPLVAHLL